MADISITPASVLAGRPAGSRWGLAGEAIVAGQAVYRDAGTWRFFKLSAGADSAQGGFNLGVARNSAAAGQPLTVQWRGPIALGEVLTPGHAYFVSGTAGAICLYDDLGIDDFVCMLGVAKSSAMLELDVLVLGIETSEASEIVLAALSLSAATIEDGAAEDTVVGSLVGRTLGSTLSLTDDAGGRFKISGTQILAGAVATDFATDESHDIVVREALVSAVNTPRDTTLTITVTEVGAGGGGQLDFSDPDNSGLLAF